MLTLGTRLLMAGDHVQRRRGDLRILSKNVILCRPRLLFWFEIKTIPICAERFIASLLIHRQI